jgi:hypothetical protein
MADNKDELAARRWFRQRLAQLGRQYPALKDPERQQRLTEALEKDESPCHAPHQPQHQHQPQQPQPANPEDDPGEVDS